MESWLFAVPVESGAAVTGGLGFEFAAIGKGLEGVCDAIDREGVSALALMGSVIFQESPSLTNFRSTAPSRR